MKAASIALAALVATASFLACSSDKPVGQLTLVLQTDLNVPKDLDWIRIEVRTDGQPLGTDSPPPLHRSDYVLDPNQPPDVRVTVPATFAVFDTKGQAEPVAIRVSAGRAGEARVLRDTFTTVPSERNAMLRVYLQWLALGSAQPAPPGADPHAPTNACPPGQTNVAGACVDARVDVTKLPEYSANAVYGADVPANGAAFDVTSCFASARTVTPDPNCTIDAAGAPLASVNVGVALAANDVGVCDSTRCIVALDRQDDATPFTTGWAPAAGGRLQLPQALCTKTKQVLLTTACPTKTAAIPACGAATTVPCTLRSAGDGGAPAPRGPIALGVGVACTYAGTTASCWGANTHHEAGQEPAGAISQRSPSSTSVRAPIRDLAIGPDMTCALDDNGVDCWGNDDVGQLGTPADGTSTIRSVPLSAVASGLRASRFGRSNACAWWGSKVACWGPNDYQQLGASTQANPNELDIGGPVHDLAVGDAFVCALLEDGGVHCWGKNDSAQLGTGSASGPQPAGATTFSIPGAVQVVAGADFGCAATPDSVTCWGDNHYGVVTGTPTAATIAPTKLTFLNGGIASLAAGADFVCAIEGLGGAVTCWGNNGQGQLGSTNPNDTKVTVDIPLAAPYERIVAGGYHTCVTAQDGGVACWGENVYGALGDPAGPVAAPKILP